jgi:predicted PurR-regulated permease PerM
VSNDADPPEPDGAPDGAAEPEGDDSAEGHEIRRRRLAMRRARAESGAEDQESITHRLATQWSQLRDVRRNEPVPVIAAGSSNFSRAQVPWGLDLAAAWAWRLIIIAAAGYGVFWVLGYFAVITLPLVIALLITALAAPAVNAMTRAGIPRGLASILMVLGGLAAIAALLTFAGQQVATGAEDLADSTIQGLGKIREWLKDGPLNASDSQINDYIQTAQDAIRDQTNDGALKSVGEIGTAVGHVFAGFFIVLFSTFFFLADGDRIWAWLVRIAPRAARERVDSSGRVAWISLTQFVRATVIVALVDSIGIMIVAAILGVPFLLALGVLVFLGAFIPLVGATVAGSVAVLVALVDQGPIDALLMLGGVILVQQIEGHILQPFLMGRWVSVHPLGVILALGCGVLVGGVAGALVAVPLAAAANAVVQHLASNTSPGDDPVEELAEDYEEIGASAPMDEEDLIDEEARDE